MGRSLCRPIAFRLAEIRTSRTISEKIRYIRRYYQYNYEYRRRIDSLQLVAMINYAIENVPYYSKRIDRGLVEKISRDPRYYMDLPILTKDLVNEAGDQLVSSRFDVKNLKKMKTGGSTGPSAFFYYDNEAADWSSATTWHCRSHHEPFYHNRQLHFACDFGETQQSPYRDLRALGEYLATNRVNIFTMDFTEGQVAYYLQQLIEKRPNLVHGHPSTMYAIAKHASKQGHSNYEGLVNFFESSGETLYPHQEELIAKVFGCKVVNRYGLAEAGVVAYQTNTSTPSLKLMSHLVYPDNFMSEGEHEFVFTSLRNFAMPLIRYNSQDVIVVGSEYFDAEDRFLTGVKGRVHDFIAIGTKQIPTHAVMDVLDHRVGNIHEFQVIKSRATGSIVLRIVPASESFDLPTAKEKLATYFGMPIGLEIVPESGLIRTGVRNKFRHLVEVD